MNPHQEGIHKVSPPGSGASHNFLKTKVAKEPRLRFSPCRDALKVVNSKEKAKTSVASSIHIRLDKWKGWDNFTVMAMDDFEMILR
jgi:hypothetical protein